MEVIRSVITADIVNSTLLSPQNLNSVRKYVESLFRRRKVRFGFYRGDGFNAVCEPDEALDIVCLLRTAARQISGSKRESRTDIRFAIGIGTIEEPYEELSSAKGDAFILSGREMDTMEKDGPRLVIRCSDPLFEAGLAAVARFTDYLVSRLTVKQSQIVHELLQGNTQMKLAQKLHRSQSTVSKHASAADWNEMVFLLGLYKRLMVLFRKNTKSGR